MERVVDGSRPQGQRAPRSKSERFDGSADTDEASPVPLFTDAHGVLWDDAGAVKDITRLVGFEATWVPRSEDGPPKVSRPEAAPPKLQSGPADALQAEGHKIIKEAMQKLKTPSEDGTLAAKLARARASKWVVVALALSVVLIAVWLGTPRESSEAAASADATGSAHSGQPNQEAAEVTSSQPSGSTASGWSQPAVSSQAIESALLGSHPCASAGDAPGVSSEITRIMPRASGVRLAAKEDFDPEAVSWLENSGQEVSSQIRGDFTGSGESRGYLWVGNNKSWNVVLLANNQTRCDVSLPTVAIAARVSKESLNRIQWDGPAPPEPSGDGLLIVRSAKDPASSVLLSLRGTEVVGSHPADYRQVPLVERK